MNPPDAPIAVDRNSQIALDWFNPPRLIWLANTSALIDTSSTRFIVGPQLTLL